MRIASFASITMLAVCAGAHGHAQDAGVQDLVSRASRYVEQYERHLSAAVCEERQTQRVVKSDGKIRKTRELVSDLMMVKSGDSTQTFRDVMSVDGKAVRDRQERLQKLFLFEPRGPSAQLGASSSTQLRVSAVTQAQAIAWESARYNIGFDRSVDMLMLPVAILHDETATRFHFARTPDGLAFDEFRSPSLLRSRLDGVASDMFLRGTLTIESGTGRLSGARLIAENPQFVLTLDVRYAEDAASGLLVPVESREDYRTPREKDRLEVSSTYSNFRRFQVIVDEQVKVP